MADLSKYQRKLVDRYYEHLDTIMLIKLQELASELYLTEGDKKRDALWKRVEKAMANLKIPASVAQHILTQRRPELLAQHLQDWLRHSKK